MITAWLGVDAPIEEADLWAIARRGNACNARRLIPFPTERGLLIADHVRHAGPHRAGVARLRRRIPGHLLPEADVWIAVLRGEGRRPSRPCSWKTVSGYLGYATPRVVFHDPARSATFTFRVAVGRPVPSDRTGHVSRGLRMSVSRRCHAGDEGKGEGLPDGEFPFDGLSPCRLTHMWPDSGRGRRG